MKVKSSLLGLFLLLTLVAVACGGAATTPEAAMEKESQDVTEKSGSEDSMMNQDSEVMKDDSDATMKEGNSDDMTADESDTIMKDDADAMAKDGSDAAVDTDSDTMADDDTTNNMDADHSDDTMNTDSDTMTGDDTTDNMDAGHADAAMNTGDSVTSSDSDTSMEEKALMELPDWFSVTLTDVNTGQTFTVSDLQDKVILVETMAIWCSNCLRQQQEVKALHEALGMEDDLVTLVLDIDPNEDADNLSAYTAKHGFEWTYAVAPREVAREIGQLYGDQFLNPPSTPMLIIDRHGEVHLLPFGRKTAEDLQEALNPFLNEEM